MLRVAQVHILDTTSEGDCLYPCAAVNEEVILPFVLSDRLSINKVEAMDLQSLDVWHEPLHVSSFGHPLYDIILFPEPCNLFCILNSE